MANPLQDPALWIPKETFLASLGDPKSQGMGQFYDKAVAKKKMIVPSLNWLAILVYPAWTGYRRQWPLLAAYTGVFMVVVVIEAVVGRDFPNSAFLGGQIAIGLMSNGQLLQMTHGRYLKLKASGFSEEQAKQSLKNQSAGSVGLAFLGAFLCFALITAAAVIAEFAVNGF